MTVSSCIGLESWEEFSINRMRVQRVKTKAIVQLTDVYDIRKPSPKQQPVSSTTGELTFWSGTS